MKKLLVLMVVGIMVLSLAMPVEARGRHRRSSEPYIEDPRMEAGPGVDVVHNFNETHALRWENRWDINNSDITGNTDDWSTKGLSSYVVYQITTDKFFENLFGK